MKRRFQRRRQRGQTITEYVLIVAVVVVAAVSILCTFSDTVRDKIVGIIHVFDPDRETTTQGSEEILQNLGSDNEAN